MAIKTSGQPHQPNRRQILIENLTAYAFLFPASLIIFTFGIFPVGFAFFVSLHRWRRFPEGFVGLENYQRAMGNLAYVVFFWLALLAFAFALYKLYQLWQKTEKERHSWAFIIPGIINAAAVAGLINWIAVALPIIMDVPNRVRGQSRSTNLFLTELFASFQYPEVAEAGNLFLVLAILALIVSMVVWRLVKPTPINANLSTFTMPFVFIITGIWTLNLTLNAIQAAITTAQESGAELPIWSQIILISLGVALIFTAYKLWQRATAQNEDRNFVLATVAAFLLLAGGYLLVVEIPQAFSGAHRNVSQGFAVTVLYALGTVPFQLTIGLGLAYLLFQNIKGKSLFRITYFLPYITPFVATSVVFTLIFSQRSGSPANEFLRFLGFDTLKWLHEPTGIFTLIFGPSVPSWLAGPGLALVVIMIFNVWIYAGYSTVIFLAGLGNIPPSLYEAARIDGASGWKVFRHITLPLLSPTTFFLSLIAIIGTLQTFTQIWLMRTSASSRAVDTINIYIFEEINASRPNYAYGSALAFVLFAVILLLTLFQNRFAGRKVFYG